MTFLRAAPSSNGRDVVLQDLTPDADAASETYHAFTRHACRHDACYHAALAPTWIGAEISR